MSEGWDALGQYNVVEIYGNKYGLQDGFPYLVGMLSHLLWPVMRVWCGRCSDLVVFHIGRLGCGRRPVLGGRRGCRSWVFVLNRRSRPVGRRTVVCIGSRRLRFMRRSRRTRARTRARARLEVMRKVVERGRRVMCRSVMRGRLKVLWFGLLNVDVRDRGSARRVCGRKRRFGRRMSWRRWRLSWAGWRVSWVVCWASWLWCRAV